MGPGLSGRADGFGGRPSHAKRETGHAADCGISFPVSRFPSYRASVNGIPIVTNKSVWNFGS